MPYAVGTSVTLRVLFGANVTDLTAAVLAGATTVAVRDATGYANNDPIVVDPGTEREERHTVSSVSGNTITLTTALAYAHPMRTKVMELADPTTVSLKVQDAAAVETTYSYPATITKDGVGRYSKTLTIDGSGGGWTYSWIGTGDVIAAEETSFEVRRTEF